MTDPQETTLNDAGESSATVESGTINGDDFDFTDDLMGTVDMPPAESSEEKNDQSSEDPKEKEGDKESSKEGSEAGSEADKEAGKEADKEADTRFDQHPRFQQLLSKISNLEARLEKTVSKESGENASAEKEKLDFKDISEMSAEEIQDWTDEDPKGYAANLLKQAKHELWSDLKAEQTQEMQQAQTEKVYEAYSEENPDFLEKWEAGEIQSFMQKNPGAVAAHMAMSTDQRIKEAVENAKKETEERVLKTLKAKGNAKSFSESPTAPTETNGKPDELTNPNKYGGEEAVLLNRFLRRQKGAA